MSKERRSVYFDLFINDRDDKFERLILRVEELHAKLSDSVDNERIDMAAELEAWLVGEGYWRPKP